MLRPVAPDPELIAWLWSYEGLEWAAKYFQGIRHNYGSFAEIKDDHECRAGNGCGVSGSVYPDTRIWRDIEAYGISGAPEEWKHRLGCCKMT